MTHLIPNKQLCQNGRPTVPRSRCLVALGMLVAVAMMLSAASAIAVDRSNVLLTEAQANRAGLSVRWIAQAALNPSNGRIADIVQQIGPRKKWFSFEVTVEDKVDVFSERDRDRYGNILGVAGARDKAEKYVNNMKDLGFEPTLEEKSHPIPAQVYIYVLTSSSRVHCMDGETGNTIWSEQIGDRDAPSWIHAANGYVAVVNGTHVHCLDGYTGVELWKKSTETAPSGRPGMTLDYVFVPTISGVVRNYSLVDEREYTGNLSSPGYIHVGLLATPNRVAWVTSRGHLNVAEGNFITRQRYIDFRLRMRSEVVAPPSSMEVPARDGESRSYNVLTGNLAGNVHCINERTGAILWVFPTAQTIRHSPLSFEKDVFATTGSKLLFCIDADTGLEKWRTSGVREVFAASESKLYGFDSADRMIMIDRKQGTNLGVMPVEAPDFYLQNIDTDRIVVGTRQGAVQCLQEMGADSPLHHRIVLDEEAQPERKKRKKDGSKPAGDLDENPFGAGADPDDPFGAGAMEDSDDPFGAGADDGADDDDDPFGADDDDPFAE